MILLWPRQPLALTNNIEPLNLVQQILLKLINLYSNLLFLDPVFVDFSEIFFNLFLSFGGHLFEVCPIFLQLN